MSPKLSLIACSAFAVIFLAGCATQQFGSGHVGALTTSKKVSAKNCRAMSKELRRLERTREVGSDEYDKVLNRYLDQNCTR